MKRRTYEFRRRVVLAAAAALNRNIMTGRGPLRKKRPLSDTGAMLVMMLVKRDWQRGRITKTMIMELEGAERSLNEYWVTNEALPYGTQRAFRLLDAVLNDLDGIEARNRTYTNSLVYGLR